MEYIEACRRSDGTSKGTPSLGNVTIGGHIMLPRGAKVAAAKKHTIERDAVKRLKDANIEVLVIAHQI